MIEGGLWLALPAQSPLAHGLTVSYLLFSNILWPIYVPLAILAIEPNAPRRRWLLLPIAAGSSTGLLFLLAIVTRPVSATIIQSHIHYQLPHSHDKIAFAFYATATCLAPMLSSNKSVRLMGAILIASMIAAYMIYSMWFASVWCYFAALISACVFLHFRHRDLAGTQVPTNQSA